MLKIGLTGGIGSGKSTVAALFAQLDVPIVDADELAHQLVKPGEAALISITTAFGNTMLTDKGELNRRALSDKIFKDTDAKQQLERILHPLIHARIEQALNSCQTAYAIAVAPLLFESNMQRLVDRILVVDCPESIQIERVLSRDQHSLEKIHAIMATQLSRDLRCKQADDIINNGNRCHQQLAEDVKTLHNYYLQLAQSI